MVKAVCYDKDQLIRPLGPWFARQSTRRGWPCYYAPVRDVIHIVLPDGKVSSHRRLRFQVFSKESFDASAEPHDFTIAVPIDVFPIDDGWRTSRYEQEEWPVATPEAELTFPMYLQMLPDHEKELLQHFSFLPGDAHTTCEMIQDFRDLFVVLNP
jgi:hypothetical protein